MKQTKREGKSHDVVTWCGKGFLHFCQTPVAGPDFSLGLGVDIVFPLSQQQEQEEQEKEPPPKYTRRKWPGSFRFGQPCLLHFPFLS